MNEAQPQPEPVRRRHVLRYLAVGAAVVAVAHALDPLAWSHLHIDNFREKSDLARLFRVMGYLPTWGIAAAALILIDWGRDKARGWYPSIARGVVLVGSAALAGGMAELGKILIRRKRPPEEEPFGYAFGSLFSDEKGVLSSSGLGMPSSHTMVAFGAMFMLCRLFPRAWVIWVLLGAACGLGRVLERDHYLSDAALAGVLAYLAAWCVWRLHRREELKLDR